MRAIIKPRLEREAGSSMTTKKRSKRDLLKAVFGGFLVVVGILGGILGTVLTPETVYADPETSTTENVDSNDNNTGDNVSTKLNGMDENTCKASLGEIGWLVCPVTGKIAEAVDWLYDKLEGILTIEPISMENGSPIYEIWKYCLSITNIVFVIFLLVVIYSQLTGMGISNYGIKKTLPKLIVVALLVNLSFLICALAVDASNIVGNGLRGVFTAVEENVMNNGAAGAAQEARVSYAGMYSSMIGGAALAVGGGIIAFETGAIWMLIPVVLGAIVAVASGLITIALRQAVVILLIMIAPLAIVAYMLPNTENLFKKWKQLFIKMLVFYPMFSLLFGASSLAGFAIISSAKDGFGVLLGTAVQIFPLFFSWKLMQMSGTFLGTINTKMRSMAAKPLATNRAWADSRRLNMKQRHLASGRPITPSLRLMQFVSNRRIAREVEIAENTETIKNRGLAYNAAKHYKKDGSPSKEGEKAYEMQAKNAQYQRVILRDKNNMNKGLGYLATGTAQKKRLERLDSMNVNSFDLLKAEQARGEKIDYENAMGFHKRMEDAINAHMDNKHGGLMDKDGDIIYKRHFAQDSTEEAAALARYNAVRKVMEGNAGDVQYVAATAAQGYDTQKKILETKMQKYFELTPPTKDVEYRLGELTKNRNAISNIDAIMPGLRVLNQRGDTDLVREQLQNVLNHGVDLGSHASQSLASFLMFEVKDNDPFLRRFGKYINLETAQVYNKNKRKNSKVTIDEYVTGEYEESDPEHPNVLVKRKSKRPMAVLMEGTSLDNMERTAMKNLDDMLKNAYTGDDKKLKVHEYLEQRKKIETAIAPQFIAASLKYLSGSEQLKSMVSFLTGYDGDGKARWEEGGDLVDGAEEAEKYFRDRTMAYLEAQTPSQILGLRSDYYDPLSRHLMKAYEESDVDGWDEKHQRERSKYLAELSDIQTRYGDLPPEEAQRKRADDMKALRNKMAGAQFKQLLDAKGKLNQIYRTRRSGAANNAKDWVREWLDLDNELLITDKLAADKRREKAEFKEKKRKEREERRKAEGDLPEDSGMDGRVYDEVDMAGFVADVEELWHDLREDGDDVFYDKSLDYIKKALGEDSFIVAKYKQFRKEDPYADSHMLKEFLTDLLNDSDNY